MCPRKRERTEHKHDHSYKRERRNDYPDYDEKRDRKYRREQERDRDRERQRERERIPNRPQNTPITLEKNNDALDVTTWKIDPENNENNWSALHKWLIDEKRRLLLDRWKTQLKNPEILKEWRDLSAEEWLEQYQEKISDSGFSFKKCESFSPLPYGNYNNKYDYSCIYRFVHPNLIGSHDQDQEDKMIIIGKNGDTDEMATGHASIAMIQRLFDLDAIPICDVFDGINFLPYECFGENGSDPVNVDMDIVHEHKHKMQKRSQNSITDLLTPDKSKSVLERFGRLYEVPIKSKISPDKELLKPKKGVKQNNEYTVTYDFTFCMRRYLVKRSGYAKKELEQDCALAVAEMLYQQGQITEPELVKKHFVVKINECKTKMLEKASQRKTRLESLDQYGLYTEQNAPTRLKDKVENILFNKNSNPIEIKRNPTDKANNNRQHEVQITARFNHPVDSYHINRYFKNDQHFRNSSEGIFRMNESEKAQLKRFYDAIICNGEREVLAEKDRRFSIRDYFFITEHRSIAQKEKTAEQKCIMRLIRWLYQMNFIEPYLLMEKDVYPKFWPIFERKDGMLTNTERFKRLEDKANCPWISLSRIEWENKGEIDYNYWKFLVSGFNHLESEFVEIYHEEYDCETYHMSRKLYESKPRSENFVTWEELERGNFECGGRDLVANAVADEFKNKLQDINSENSSISRKVKKIISKFKKHMKNESHFEIKMYSTIANDSSKEIWTYPELSKLDQFQIKDVMNLIITYFNSIDNDEFKILKKSDEDSHVYLPVNCVNNNEILFTINFQPFALTTSPIFNSVSIFDQYPTNFDIWKIYKYILCGPRFNQTQAYHSIINILMKNLDINKCNLAKQFFNSNHELLQNFFERLTIITLYHMFCNRKRPKGGPLIVEVIHSCFKLWQNNDFYQDKKTVKHYFNLIFSNLEFSDNQELKVEDDDLTIFDLLVINMPAVRGNLRTKKMMMACIRSFVRKIQSLSLCYSKEICI